MNSTLECVRKALGELNRLAALDEPMAQHVKEWLGTAQAALHEAWRLESLEPQGGPESKAVRRLLGPAGHTHLLNLLQDAYEQHTRSPGAPPIEAVLALVGQAIVRGEE